MHLIIYNILILLLQLHFFYIGLRKLFKKGLYKGKVYLRNMRLVLMGPPCIGKTSFKSLLFNWPAPRVHHSTALATRPVRAFERVAEKKKGKIWDRVTRRDLLKMLSDSIRSIEQLLHELNDPTLENAATSTSLPSQLTSYVTGNSSKQLKPFEGSNSSSDVKEGYSSSVDTADVSPICNSSTIMPSKTISLSSDVDAKSLWKPLKFLLWLIQC